MWKQRNMKIGGDWHHMLGVFFCFPTGRWEVSGKLAKKVWAYIENLHVYLLFQICKKIVNIHWKHNFLKGRKNILWQRPVSNGKNFYKFSTTYRQKPVIICNGLGCHHGEKTMLREKWHWPQNPRTKSKESIQIKGWRKTKESPEYL